MNDSIEMLITPRPRDLGNFHVRRVLPYAKRRTIGPFIFFDHMGPAQWEPGGNGLDVRPHPHIGLATVTYLFEGRIFHRDSLGSAQVIEPGAINWMTAGRGIVHSERTPSEERAAGGRLHGLQMWVALPKTHEETEPTFKHHPADTLPRFTVGNARCKLLVGTAFGHQSPVHAFSDLFYLEVHLDAKQSFTFPGAGRECAAYPVSGRVLVDGEEITTGTMAVARTGDDLIIENLGDETAHLMLLGGAPLDGPREIWWNLVSSSKERIETAKRDWAEGRFPKVPGDETEFIPLPPEWGIPPIDKAEPGS